MLASDPMEDAILSEIVDRQGCRLSSQQIGKISLNLFFDRYARGLVDARSLVLLRLAIKSHPESEHAGKMIAAYREVVQSHAASNMPSVLDTVASCNQLEVPVPVIIGCIKYLAQAKSLARCLKPHYFNIDPIIIIGGDDLSVLTGEDIIMRLPVSDMYEALPYKVFETLAVFAAIGARGGVLKIDDDIRIVQDEFLEIGKVKDFFTSVDYAGRSIPLTHVDRAWHYGKCSTRVSPLYAKPFFAPYAGGPLYYLSHDALSAIATFYLQYPGYLAGELYEDKLVGEVAHRLGFTLVDCPLGPILSVSTDAPERVFESH